MSLPAERPADRVLVLAPFGRDAEMVRDRLAGAAIACEVCPDLGALLASMASPAGAALIALEALGDGGAESLLAALERQEPWSDLPVVLLTDAAARTGERESVLAGIFERANVTLLERPVRVRLLVSALRASVRARRRQYQTRDLLEELQRAIQLSDLFVSILGHDLRTPLGAIRVSAETILRRSQEAATLRPAGRILNASDRMMRMIEQLLDFARARQGQGIRLQPSPADLGALCRQAVEEVEGANPQAQIGLRETGRLSGLWDPDRLAQLFTNLLSNAAQHGDPGEAIAVELDGTAPQTVRARIRNSGTVPAEALPTLFEAFKRPPPATASGARTGLGLGLFIARAIARAHGGDIAVEASGGQTTFEVTLPRQAPHP